MVSSRGATLRRRCLLFLLFAQMETAAAALHSCDGVAWAIQSGVCAPWARADAWTRGSPPEEGDLVEVLPPPGAPLACVSVDQGEARATEIVVGAVGGGGPSRLRVRAGGRIKLSGTRTGDTGLCSYPSPAPSVSMAPSAPSPSPSSLPTPAPTADTRLPSMLPTQAPSTMPTPTLFEHSCLGVALTFSTGAGCSSWEEPDAWTTGTTPTVGDLIEAKPPPTPGTGFRTSGACLDIDGVDAVASEVDVSSSVDGWPMQVRIRDKGRLVIKGEVAGDASEGCSYPSPSPTASAAPSLLTPTVLPTHAPSMLPSPDPTALPSLITAPSPTPLPTHQRLTHTCGAVANGVVDDAMDCTHLWSDPSSWFYGSAPKKGDLVEVVPVLEASSSCLAVSGRNESASKVVLKGTVMGGRVRIRVVASGRLTVSGAVSAPSESQCVYPTLSPTALAFEHPTSIPTPLPTTAPSASLPTPAPTIQNHRCGGVAWSVTTGECASWHRDENWSTGAVPTEGDFVEVTTAPGASAACVEVDEEVEASEVEVWAAHEGSEAQLRVRTGGRLVIKGTTTNSSDGSHCLFPSPAPSFSSAPTVPSVGPSHVPTAAPSPAPWPRPSVLPIPLPTPTPSPQRYAGTCGAFKVASVDDGFLCTNLWSAPGSWVDGVVPNTHDLVEAFPPLEGSSTCLSIETTANASTVHLRGTVLGGHMRVKVISGGSLRVSGRVTSTTDGAQCATPSVHPTTPSPSASPSLAPSPAPTMQPSLSYPTPQTHGCSAVAWTRSSAECLPWDRASFWSTGAVPSLGDLVEIGPSPSVIGPCVTVSDDESATEIQILPSAKLRVVPGGRLKLSGSLVVDDPSLCSFPSSIPTSTQVPTAPTPGPSRAPSLSPTSPSLEPTAFEPTPRPTPQRFTHSCSSAAPTFSGDECSNWGSPDAWSTGVVPSEGTYVEAKPPPVPELAAPAPAESTCMSIKFDAAASLVDVESSLDGRHMRISLRQGARLIIKGHASSDDTQCTYSTPAPSLSAAPSSPSPVPSRSPTLLTRSPSEVPSFPPVPSPHPTVAALKHDCNSVVLSVIDESMSCAALWSDPSSWLGNISPQLGDTVDVAPVLKASSSCLTIDSKANASRISVQGIDTLAKVRLRVIAGARLRVSGQAGASNGTLCSLPTLAPTVFEASSLSPSSAPTSRTHRPSPSPTLRKHLCSGIGWNVNDGSCQSWDRSDFWTTAHVPATGSIVEIKPPPQSNLSSCVYVEDFHADATEVILNGKSRLSIKSNGRLRLSGEAANASDDQCSYPSPLPTAVTANITFAPTRLPTNSPSPAPAPIPSVGPSVIPTPLPSPSRHTAACDAAKIRRSDDTLKCDANWEDSSTWLGNLVPNIGKLHA